MKSILILAGILFLSCQTQGNEQTSIVQPVVDTQNLEKATFAGGCFWCVEASFEQIKGVASAVSGYAGGKKSTAKYKLVSSGQTEHAEAVQVFYDPEVIDYNTLLDIFFTAHDPTQVNRQGPDVGPQYRSAIFYHDDEQKRLAEAKIKEWEPTFDQPIATELNPYTEFFEAEAYHQDYEKNNPYNPYILSVSRPKINKVAKKFKDLLKKEAN